MLKCFMLNALESIKLRLCYSGMLKSATELLPFTVILNDRLGFCTKTNPVSTHHFSKGIQQ